MSVYRHKKTHIIATISAYYENDNLTYYYNLLDIHPTVLYIPKILIEESDEWEKLETAKIIKMEPYDPHRA